MKTVGSCLNEAERIRNEWTERFDNTPKVIIISPPRSASTLLTVLLNLNPRFFVFCESCMNHIFTKNVKTVGRLCSYSRKRAFEIQHFFALYCKGNISFKDFYMVMTISNSRMKQNIQNEMVIGDKNPLNHGGLDFVKWATSEPNFFFPCVIKDDLSLFVKSQYANNESLRTGDTTARDSIIGSATGIFNYVSGLKELINSSENFHSRSFFCKFSDFVVKPENYLNNLFTSIDPLHQFSIEKYDVDKYGDSIKAMLGDKLYGLTGHMTEKTGELKHHQIGLLKNIKYESTTASNQAATAYVDRLKTEVAVFDKWDEMISSFPFSAM